MASKNFVGFRLLDDVNDIWKCTDTDQSARQTSPLTLHQTYLPLYLIFVAFFDPYSLRDVSHYI